MVLDVINDLVEVAIDTQEVDMTETGTGGSAPVLLNKGEYFGRFFEYIELGKQPREYMGTAKSPANMCRVGFIVYQGDNKVYLRSSDLTIMNNEKALFKKLFDRMNSRGTIKHIAQRLGDAFKLEVEVKTSKKGKKYNVFNMETVSEVPAFDPNTGQPVNIPKLNDDEYRIFIWNKPTQGTWDSLYIESNNFIQDTILGAVDFEGSPLQAMLSGLDELVQGSVDSTGSTDSTAPVAPTAPTAPAAPVAPSAPAEPSIDFDDDTPF